MFTCAHVCACVCVQCLFRFPTASSVISGASGLWGPEGRTVAGACTGMRGAKGRRGQWGKGWGAANQAGAKAGGH